MRRARTLSRVAARFHEFTQTESSSGIVLLACTAAAMLWANSPWQASYFDLWHTEAALSLGNWQLSLDLHHWINDGLMALFFFLVGLEIKRELLVGELSTPRQAALPLFGALGGMLLPALIFVAFNHSTPQASGWGVPVATDIAFALAVLALLGKRVPLGLKIFLTALAIVDDMGAVAVIALFYTSQLNLSMLGLAAAGLGICALLNWVGIMRVWPYALLGAFVWYAVLMSGVHATVAGVLLALCIPARSRIDLHSFIDTARGLLDRLSSSLTRGRPADKSAQHLGHAQTELVTTIEECAEQVMTPLERLERVLQFPVAFVIMPLFALANSGIALGGVNIIGELLSPVSLGVVLGLVLGKQVGVTFFAWLAVKLKLATLPEGVGWPLLYGTAWICGIGFTMSLFIANLAFGSESSALSTAKLAILAASAIAGGGGYLFLRRHLQTLPVAPTAPPH